MKVVITSVSRWKCFQWFILGFYEMQKKGKIKLEFNTPIIDAGEIYINSKIKTGIYNRFNQYFRHNHDNYNMLGYIQYDDGIKKHFALIRQIHHFYLIVISFRRLIVTLKCNALRTLKMRDFD